METRLLIAYALMLVMALAGAVIAYLLWNNAHPRVTARRQLRDRREHEQRRAEQDVTQADRRSAP